ncbi:MAG: hypothetical protein HOE80_02700 [Candidatus Magasanikbacteria bacterium]|jgi:hypothetical protein|nr:hypothetical protein [Candidatus Magasanikbacteria bacterium]MBT4071609.1 hypothetical protein [Candidatus Magasanikbacteria bacterium]
MEEMAVLYNKKGIMPRRINKALTYSITDRRIIKQHQEAKEVVQQMTPEEAEKLLQQIEKGEKNPS